MEQPELEARHDRVAHRRVDQIALERGRIAGLGAGHDALARDAGGVVAELVAERRVQAEAVADIERAGHLGVRPRHRGPTGQDQRRARRAERTQRRNT